MKINEQNATAMIAAARSWLGTPFHHQGRAPHVGLDCLGLLVCAARAAGLAINDRTDYPWRPDGKALLAGLEEHGAVRVNEMQAGDVLLFRFDNQPQHLAIVSDAARMIHAYAPAGKVVETTISAAWLNRLIGIYRF